jgi:hypothetical protein
MAKQEAGAAAAAVDRGFGAYVSNVCDDGRWAASSSEKGHIVVVQKRCDTKQKAVSLLSSSPA